MVATVLISVTGWNVSLSLLFLSADRDEWSVHGLWPTRFGEINPNFCNSSWTYNHDQMKDILGEMSRYWPDVEMRHVVDSLWSHEWTKHGTCAVVSAKETHITNQTEYFRYCVLILLLL